MDKISTDAENTITNELEPLAVPKRSSTAIILTIKGQFYKMLRLNGGGVISCRRRPTDQISSVVIWNPPPRWSTDQIECTQNDTLCSENKLPECYLISDDSQKQRWSSRWAEASKQHVGTYSTEWPKQQPRKNKNNNIGHQKNNNNEQSVDGFQNHQSWEVLFFINYS